MADGNDAERVGAEQLPAGRELDAMVAERVFGWRWYRWLDVAGIPEEYHGRFIAHPDRIGGKPGVDYTEASLDMPLSSQCWGSLPGYSTRIEAAWEVVRNLAADGWCYSLDNLGAYGAARCVVWRHSYAVGPYRRVEAEGAAPATAICRAALAALAPETHHPEKEPLP